MDHSVPSMDEGGFVSSNSTAAGAFPYLDYVAGGAGARADRAFSCRNQHLLGMGNRLLRSVPADERNPDWKVNLVRLDFVAAASGLRRAGGGLDGPDAHPGSWRSATKDGPRPPQRTIRRRCVARTSIERPYARSPAAATAKSAGPP